MIDAGRLAFSFCPPFFIILFYETTITITISLQQSLLVFLCNLSTPCEVWGRL